MTGTGAVQEAAVEVEVTEANIRVTKDFYDKMFPPVSALQEVPPSPNENAIIEEHILVYSKQGHGKSEKGNSIVSEARRRYGAQNVNSWAVSGEHFKELLFYCFRPVLVNILILEDITKVALAKEDVVEFFRVRHKMYERTGQNHGLVLLIITTHRFHATPLELRTDSDFILFSSTASGSPYDANIVKGFIGKYGVMQLRELEPHMVWDKPSRGFAFIFGKMGRGGLAYFQKEPMVIGKLIVEDKNAASEGNLNEAYGAANETMVKSWGTLQSFMKWVAVPSFGLIKWTFILMGLVFFGAILLAALKGLG